MGPIIRSSHLVIHSTYPVKNSALKAKTSLVGRGISLLGWQSFEEACMHFDYVP